MAPALATKRLTKELVNIKKDPPPGLIAEPHDSDILTWYYAVRGPVDTPYETGIYIGKLKFSPEYPLKAPSIYMLTPSGRFQVSTKLCMSMSDFHPESWNPLWSVSTIIQGVQSFMASDELTTGGLKASKADRQAFARASQEYNAKNYGKLFGGDLEAAFAEAEAARCQAEKTKVVDNSGTSAGSINHRRRRTRNRTKPRDTEQEQEVQEEEDEEEEEAPANKELSAAEVEKRRKKNAKKRAKQKAKKAATKLQDDQSPPTDEIEALAVQDD